MIARAGAQVVRLSCIYALLDISPRIKVEHLKAALAVWDYCEASCRYIFGDKLGDPVADELLKALRNIKPEGIPRTKMNRMFSGHKPSRQIDRALELLKTHGLARHEMQKTEGRSTEVWFAT